MLMTQTLDKLDALGLFGMVLGLREQLESNQYLNLSFDERLGLLVDREAETRDSRRLALRLKAAKLRQEATVEDLDFRAPRGLDRSVVLSLAQAGWVAAHHNLLITGPTGAGKSFVSCALAHAAVRRGHTTLYVRTPRLLAELALSRGDGRYIRRLGQLARIGVLVLDDFLLTPPNVIEANSSPATYWCVNAPTPTSTGGRNPRCVISNGPAGLRLTYLDYDCVKGGDQLTDCTSIIDIASTHHRCSSLLADDRNQPYASRRTDRSPSAVRIRRNAHLVAAQP